MIGWTRRELKFRARQEMKAAFWPAYWVCLVGTLLGGGGGGSASSSASNSYSGSGGSASDGLSWLWDLAAERAQPLGELVQGMSLELDRLSAALRISPLAVRGVGLLGGVFGAVFSFALLYGIFVAGPIRAGMSHYFIRAPYGDRRFRLLFSSFGAGRYLSIVATQLVTGLCLAGWTLLVLIPGMILVVVLAFMGSPAISILAAFLCGVGTLAVLIVKSYEYQMVPYIISEQPQLGPGQARRYSRQMTDGHKLNMFVLDLSFLGWFLLYVVVIAVVAGGWTFVALTAGAASFAAVIGSLLALIPIFLLIIGAGNVITVYTQYTYGHLYLTLRQVVAQPQEPQGYGGQPGPDQPGGPN